MLRLLLNFVSLVDDSILVCYIFVSHRVDQIIIMASIGLCLDALNNGWCWKRIKCLLEVIGQHR